MDSRKRAPLVALTTLGVVLLLLVTYPVAGWSEEGLRTIVRWTAKIAVLLFAAAFSAGSLRSLWRVEATRWLMLNRRGLGLSFALVHTTHLAALIVLGLAFPAPFVDELNPVTLVGGGLGYGFMFAMAATSNDASVRRLGARRWQRLHTTGGWFIWFIFTVTYLPLALGDPQYAPWAILTLAVLALRIARRLRRPRAAIGLRESVPRA